MLASGMPDLSTRSPPAAAWRGAGLPAKITVAQICPRICISPQKIFRLGSRCKSAVSLSSEWESGFIFEYLDLCQSPANIWEGTRVDREVKEMNRDFRGIPLHSAFRSETRDIMAFPPFHFHSFLFFLFVFVIASVSIPLARRLAGLLMAPTSKGLLVTCQGGSNPCTTPHRFIAFSKW